MDGQMTIFDFIQQDDFTTMPEDQVMRIISERIGLELVYDGKWNEYAAKLGKITISVKISSYRCTHGGLSKVIEGNKFICCNWQGSTEGGGSPRDSIDDAVRYLQSIILQHGGKRG